jgi:hypothetical protein
MRSAGILWLAIHLQYARVTFTFDHVLSYEGIFLVAEVADINHFDRTGSE